MLKKGRWKPAAPDIVVPSNQGSFTLIEIRYLRSFSSHKPLPQHIELVSKSLPDFSGLSVTTVSPALTHIGVLRPAYQLNAERPLATKITANKADSSAPGKIHVENSHATPLAKRLLRIFRAKLREPSVRCRAIASCSSPATLRPGRNQARRARSWILSRSRIAHSTTK